MPDETPPPAVVPRAVFLGCASQDIAAAQRIGALLRAAGVEVWLDQGELVGGDAWYRKIREQIKSCALFAPIISASTQARREGYFRLEWKLAAQRTHTIADGTPFLLPIVIDASRDADALVPEEFRAVQWTRLPDGPSTPLFVERVRKLLMPPVVGPVADRAPDQRSGLQSSPAPKVGVGTGIGPAPPSEPCRRISRTRLSSW